MPYKKITALMACTLATFLITLPTVSGQVVEPDEHGFMIASPEDQHPAEGSRSVNIIGNPSEEGLYVIQITFPPGSGSRPHFHNTARYINVLKGTWWVSTGPESGVYDPDNMRRVEAGTFIYEPPMGHHYDMAKDEEVTVQIMGYGPVVTRSLEN